MKHIIMIALIVACLGLFVLLFSSQINAIEEYTPRRNVISAHANIDSYIEQKTSYQQQLEPLISILKYQISQKNVSVYYQDLSTDAQFSINGEKRYIPGSLFKLITFVSILKEVENQNIVLNESITIQNQDRNPMYGDLWKNQSGYSMSVLELLDLAAIQSDNTAGSALRRQIPNDVYSNMLFSCGIPYNSPIEDNIPRVKAEDIGALFDSLYRNSCLREASNDLILSLLSQPKPSAGLSTYIPDTVVVANKIGVWYDENNNHDCGIIYHEKKPYILCVMTKNLPLHDSTELIGRISQQIYTYIENIS